MRIVFITPSYKPNIGGVERHVEGITRLLSKAHEVTIITEQTKEVSKDKNVIQIPTLGVTQKNKKWVIWKWIFEHQELLNNADIIHVHDVMYWLYPYKLLHPLKKIFITFHGWEGIYPIPIKNIVLHKINELLATANICVGDFICKWYHTKAGLITYGATDIPKHTYKSSGKTKKILFLGRLAEDTGFRQCIDLYESHKKKFKWKLLVAGEGPLGYLCPSDAVLVGPVFDPGKHIQDADYVFASGYLSILESLVRKKIVLASYDNPVKKDYLTMHPAVKFININGQITSSPSKEAYNWAVGQTWEKLVSQYLLIWQKKKSQ